MKVDPTPRNVREALRSKTAIVKLRAQNLVQVFMEYVASKKGRQDVEVVAEDGRRTMTKGFISAASLRTQNSAFRHAGASNPWHDPRKRFSDVKWLCSEIDKRVVAVNDDVNVECFKKPSELDVAT